MVESNGLTEVEHRSPLRRAVSRLVQWSRVRYSFLFAPAGREQTISQGVAAGLRISTGASNPHYAIGDNEIPVQCALESLLRPGHVFYDVGANVGFMTLVGALLVGPRGSVYAFEPVPANARILRKNVRSNGVNQVSVIEKAVSLRSGRANLVLAAYSGGSSLASAETPPDALGEVGVELTSIDELVSSGAIRPPDVVKIDVEGAEQEVLEGMRETLATARPVLIYELDAAELQALEGKEISCELFLRENGYAVERLQDSYPEGRWLVRHYLARPRPGPSGVGRLESRA